ncbi:beta-galactosidase [Bifidobacterium sp. 82T10]|uniref:Beta-galactosidase n=1 Tax=Bifidobacterium miconis TaxID=2834435 RepID=A0ABS6WHI4_9BIFI|nr:beta-galactosidase [Bifidobacterium miconis]MBW3093510.1 beta-galactosidase [Bifidobacterium miconis]
MTDDHRIDLTSFVPAARRPIDITTDYQPRDRPRIGFTDHGLTFDGRPRYIIAGELHFSRMSSRRWDDELAKMRMAGVNTVSTYVFWNHHEEHEGVWDFTGSRDLRAFVELCAKHGLYVILRPGPFNHGECRNGGLPDWLYGKPYRVRSCDQGFLDDVRSYYARIGEQIQGLLYEDGGPIIASQLDNEYMHSSAPWEMTTGISDEWVYSSREGDAYMRALKRIAVETGIRVPFYTCTGWGGAPVPPDMLPLWGGYAYWPWIFYQNQSDGQPRKHPLTEEYVYRDYRSQDPVLAGDFRPPYDPTTRPYACAEMGGGMMVSYHYRFSLPYKSVDAMTNVKMASGCNFLGYYVFHGGTNPKGDGIYFNESQVSKISYDYQATIGEFGQLRESYRRVKSLHYFANAFGDDLCRMDTVTPRESAAIRPDDLDSLRYALRTDGTRGFLFLNNFQDHATMQDRHDQSVAIRLADGDDAVFDRLSLAADENCVLPFNMDLDGIMLRTATAQPVTRIRPHGENADTFVFLTPRGMGEGRFVFDADAAVSGCLSRRDPAGANDGEDLRIAVERDKYGRTVVLVPERAAFARFDVTVDGAHARIVCVNRPTADRMFVVRGEALVFSDDAVYERDGELVVESMRDGAGIVVYPADYCRSLGNVPVRSDGPDDLLGRAEIVFDKTGMVAESPVVAEEVSSPDAIADPDRMQTPTVTRLADDRYAIGLPSGFLSKLGAKDALLRIRYRGDIGWLFCGSELVHDNFCNGDPWDIGLREFADRIPGHGLTLVITPLKKGAKVNVDSPMAARMETSDETVCELLDVSLVPVRELVATR